MKAGKIRLKDIGKPSDQMIQLNPADFMRLPYPYDKADSDPDFKQLTEDQKKKYEASLDGVLAISIPKPETKGEEDELVRKFLSGLEKLLTKENNWTFLQPLTLSLEYCAKCQTCNEACPIYTGSGKQEIYRPTYRSEVLRAIVNKYIKGKKTFAKFSG
ncbi:MAG: hypothetical protein FD151_1077, partial [bacterium]